jgi:hypothetical protein
MGRIRTTQELLDSTLVLVGWRVYVRTSNGPSYAMGDGRWTLDKNRAFLFTDAPHSARKGNDDGLRWARAHARHLIAEHTKRQWPDRPLAPGDDEPEYDVLKPRIVCIRKRVWPQPPRSTTDPTQHKSNAQTGSTDK